MNESASETSPFLRLNFATVWVRNQERSLRFFVDQFSGQEQADDITLMAAKVRAGGASFLP